MPPHRIGLGTQVQFVFTVLNIGVLVQGQGAHGVLLAGRHPLHQSVVHGVVKTGVCVRLPGPAVLLIQRVGEVEVGFHEAVSAYVHGPINILAVPRVVGHGLSCPAIVICTCQLEMIVRVNGILASLVINDKQRTLIALEVRVS